MDDSEQALTIANHAKKELLLLEDETAEAVENRMEELEIDVPAIQEDNVVEVDNSEAHIVEEGLIILPEDNIVSEEEDFIEDEEETQDDSDDGQATLVVNEKAIVADI